MTRIATHSGASKVLARIDDEGNRKELETRLKMDQCLSAYSSQASHISSISGLAFASLVGQFTRLGVLSLLNTPVPGLKTFISQTTSIAAESLTLEATHHFSESAPSNPFFDSLFHSAITLTAFRLSAPWVHGQSFLIQQGLQAATLVSAQRLASRCDFVSQDIQNLGEEFTSALASNFSLSTGLMLSHRLTGGRIRGLEARSQSLSEIQNQAIRPENVLVKRLVSSASPEPLLYTDFQERACQSRSFLEFATEAILDGLQGRTENLAFIPDYLAGARENHQWTLQKWTNLEAETPHANNASAIARLQAEFSELFHIERQLRICHERMNQEFILEGDLWEIRRRFNAVLVRPGFDRYEVNWDRLAPLPELFDSTDLESRYDIARRLLTHLHPNLQREDLASFERAASDTIQGRHIAFDLDGTIGDTLRWHLAQSELAKEKNQALYDISDFDYFAYQRTLMRIPYARMQATLLGLWAGGNTLKLYTQSPNRDSNHDAFFNDFPLLKLAFGIVTPDRVLDVVTPADLHASPNYMDEIKRRDFQARHFETQAGRVFAAQIFQEAEVRHLREFPTSKIPFPDFLYDVLIDDCHSFAGEMQTLGFGRRYLEARKSGDTLLDDLESYFSQPIPPATPTLEAWLYPTEVDSASTIAHIADRMMSRGRNDRMNVNLDEVLANAQSPEAARGKVLAMIREWHNSCNLAIHENQMSEVRTRVQGLPTYIQAYLGSLSSTRPLLLAHLLISLDILPSEMEIRRSPPMGTVTNLETHPERVSRPDDYFRENADLTLSRFETARRIYLNNNATLHDAERRAWAERFRQLDPLSISVLLNYSISDAHFLYFSYQLGLQREGFPPNP